MERHKNAIKAARQSEKRRLANSSARAAVRTAVRNFEAKLASLPKSKDEALKVVAPALNSLQSVLMKAGHRRLISKEAASRKIARLNRKIEKLFATA